MMQIEKIRYRDWNTAYRCVHNSVELIVVTEIGPRVLCFRHAGGDNILFEDTASLTIEPPNRIFLIMYGPMTELGSNSRRKWLEDDFDN
jgi:hypothetical protein